MGRTAFYTQAQYDNHTALIQKEDAARVRGIIRERDLPEAQRAEEARIEQFRASERAAVEARQNEEDKMNEAIERRKVRDERVRLQQSQRRGSNGAPKHITATERAAAKHRTARIMELSNPKSYDDAMYGSGTYGYVMHQHGHGVVFPEGRNGAVYCPGVDRHRLVPARPNLGTTTPPWVGSYSSHHGARCEASQKKDAQAEARFYLSASKRSAQERQARHAAIDEMEADQQRQQQRDSASTNTEATAALRSQDPANAQVRFVTSGHQAEDVYSDDNDDVPSLFSHTSSNGAVADTGCQHMGLQSTKPDVARHLALGGSAALRSSRGANAVAAFDALTLPELSTRIVRMQQRTK